MDDAPEFENWPTQQELDLLRKEKGLIDSNGVVIFE